VPNEAAHTLQASRNEKVYTDILGGQNAKYSEWAITALFYAAVHRVETYLASEQVYPQVHPKGHGHRLKALKDVGKQEAGNTLQALQRTSEQARYQCARFSSEEIGSYKAELDSLVAKLS